MMRDIFPPVEQALELEPEELAMFLLKFLSNVDEHLMQLTYVLNQSRNYSPEQKSDITDALTEAWMWLEIERMLAPRGGNRDSVFITRRGRALLTEGDLAAYQRRNLLKEMTLDPALAREVHPTYIRGDYETAVFQAFKEVEVRVRKASGLGNNKIGVALMREAFKPQRGSLTDASRDGGERTAMMETFAGAIGLMKNPASHRNTELDDPQEAAEAILWANYLLRLLDGRQNV